jgi:hypothetical protein
MPNFSVMSVLECIVVIVQNKCQISLVWWSWIYLLCYYTLIKIILTPIHLVIWSSKHHLNANSTIKNSCRALVVVLLSCGFKTYLLNSKWSLGNISAILFVLIRYERRVVKGTCNFVLISHIRSLICYWTKSMLYW